ncbi:hypothetical protein GOV09_04415 [Candidatus Woesearchaeota archaeon]|nr:hypothetical protein [Candidatus Woesearchaeota archaeon]
MAGSWIVTMKNGTLPDFGVGSISPIHQEQAHRFEEGGRDILEGTYRLTLPDFVDMCNPDAFFRDTGIEICISAREGAY